MDIVKLVTKKCKPCNGTGRREVEFWDNLYKEMTCPDCLGDGIVLNDIGQKLKKLFNRN